MTITYSLNVANTRFCGFAKLLGRWRGSIYKILWKEFLVFIAGYTLLSVTYRFFLSESQKRHFEDVVRYFETFIDLIPLSFVLGFYVTLAMGRWWSQFEAIPWPDRVCHKIGAYVHGADDRSRMIRRTLGRYLILLQAIAFQSVSTAVKKRFPTSQHLVNAGLMTKEEQTIYEKVPCLYPKWWWPVQWFCSLLMRAKKEGRIQDLKLLDSIFNELLTYRNGCANMIAYDWISIPLVYTQVVTLATYTYSLALMVGRQYLDPARDDKRSVDLYIPIFTLLKFFFAMGWLKVAEQIVNPYGEDDDDFELNWCLDRNIQIVYLLVDHFHAKHPKIRKDIFWDEMLPQLPHTRTSAKNINPQLGSAFNMKVNPEDAAFLPVDTLIEHDKEANIYSSDTIKHRSGTRTRPSFLMNFWNSNFSQMIRRRSTGSFVEPQGHVNSGFSLDNGKFVPVKGSPANHNRKSSLVKMSSPANNRASSIPFHPHSAIRPNHKVYDVQMEDFNSIPNGSIPESEAKGFVSTVNAAMAPVVGNFESVPPDVCEIYDKNVKGDRLHAYMPPIREELSRAVSHIRLGSIPEASSTPDMDDVQCLVDEASKVLEELNRAVNVHGHKKLRGYESSCSLESTDSSSDEAEDTNDTQLAEGKLSEKDSVIIDVRNPGCSQIENNSVL